MAQPGRLFAPLNPPIRQWRGQTVWLIGASSGIGRATASALHAQGATVIVSARNAQALDEFAGQHPGAVPLSLDVTDAQAVRKAAEFVTRHHGLQAVVYCAGHYVEMSAQTFDLAQMSQHQQVNYLGVLNVLDAVLPHFLQASNQAGQNHTAHISLIASVAGYHGLPKSLAYGPTKAAMINLAETLYLDLHAQKIGVSLICPGFVDTPLTAGNQFAMPALISPQQAATEILRGWARGDFEIHFPKRFTLWLKLLRLLPYRVAFAATRRLTRH
jgi:NAD(P)-dependent dehydrogenase (short-subunit alcohol dehydrogenase family)